MRLVANRLERLAAGTRAYARRHWQRALRIREKFRFSEEAFHLLLAGGVGIIGGFVNLCFYYATEGVKGLFLARPGAPEEIAEIMRMKGQNWQLLAIPTLGGLLAGLVLYWGLRLVGPQGSSNILEVVVAGDGRLPLRSGLVKFFSSLITIGSGGSIGREGALVQLSAMFASKWGQLAKWPPYRLRLLVGCGAASGISAAYNAPISGAVFAALIVLGNFSMGMFAPLVFASVVATMVSRTFFGIKPWYTVPAFEFTSLTQLPWFVLLGIVTGGAGALFLKMLTTAEDAFKRLRAPIYIRTALGGLIVGIIALQFPGVWGNGYVITSRILRGEYGSSFLAPAGGFPPEVYGLLFLTGLFLAKLLATLATVGSGAVGGVFTPTLFLGAGLGAAFGLALQQLGAERGVPIAPFAVVGMGGMLSATTRSPLLAMIMVFEISLDYSLMPPLMLASVVSVMVARKLHHASIYTEPLAAKGAHVLDEARLSEAATHRTVGEMMRAPVPPLRENATMSDIADRFLTSSNNYLPVVDGKSRLVGLVALHDLKEYLSSGDELRGIIAYDVMRPPPACVTPNQRLSEILPVVLASEQRNIPVVNTLKENRLIGALGRSEVLGLFSEAISAKGKSEG